MSAILPTSHKLLPVPSSDAALTLWSHGHSVPIPLGLDAFKENKWDSIITTNTASSLLEGAGNETERARLLAVMERDSGARLQALPVTSVGLRMDDTTLRIGTTICAPHICQCCGVEVSAQGTHGLSCKASSGRHFHHAAMNDIIVHTMSAAGIPARLEPPGLSRSDGKRSDGMSFVPWGQGRPLIWDATCPDTFAVSY